MKLIKELTTQQKQALLCKEMEGDLPRRDLTSQTRVITSGGDILTDLLQAHRDRLH